MKARKILTEMTETEYPSSPVTAIKYPRPARDDAEIHAILTALRQAGIHAKSSAEFSTHVLVSRKDEEQAQAIVNKAMSGGSGRHNMRDLGPRTVGW